MGEVIDAERFESLMRDATELRRTNYRKGLRPPPPQTINQWSDQHRQLSGVASAEPGQYKTDRTPFFREVMECLSPSSPVQWVVVRKAAQVGATELGNNWVAYFVDVLGGAMLVVQPTVEMAKRWSKQRLAPMLRDTPKLHGKVQEARSRDSGNTLQSKEFAGGLILITGANSAVGLRSMSAPWLFFDEVDAYPDMVDEEGHPIDVAWFRSVSFPFRKVLEVSTPKVKHASRIDNDIEASDQAYYYVPCPVCRGKGFGEFQRLDPERLVYSESDPIDCEGMACEHCGAIIPEGKKTEILHEGRWFRFDEASKTWVPRPVEGLKAGFSIEQMYSPIGLGLTWGEIAQRREASKTDDSAARTYFNLVRGMSYEEKSDAPQWEALYERRENYREGMLPTGAYMLVGTADIQGDRIEVAWHAFGREFEAWYIDHVVLEGDTSGDAVWKLLTEAQQRRFPHVEGTNTLPADLFLVDMQYQTESVKLWVRNQRNPRRIRAVQGADSWGSPAVIGRSQTDLTNVGDKKTKKRGFHFWRLSSPTLKIELYRRLRRQFPADSPSPFGGPWIHHPQVSDEWMKQMVSERIVRKKKVGSRTRSRLVFEKTRERNEGLDLTYYALAAGYMLRAEQLTEASWLKYEKRWKRESNAADKTEQLEETAQDTPRRRQPIRRRKNWVTGY